MNITEFYVLIGKTLINMCTFCYKWGIEYAQFFTIKIVKELILEQALKASLLFYQFDVLQGIFHTRCDHIQDHMSNINVFVLKLHIGTVIFCFEKLSFPFLKTCNSISNLV